MRPNPTSNKQSQKKSDLPLSLPTLIETVLFIVAIILLQIPMLYVVQSQTYYTQDPHPLNLVFEREEYEKILKTLKDPNQRYILLKGTEDKGVTTFVKNFAADIKQKRAVLIREYTNDEFQAIYSVFRFAKQLVEQQLDIQKDHAKIWILIYHDHQIDKNFIQEIKIKNPEDRIIIVSSLDNKFKGFKKLVFPDLELDQIQTVLQEKLRMDPETSNILISHYNSIPEVFNNLNQHQFCLASHVGEQNYKKIELEEMAQGDKEIIQFLCKQGVATGSKDNLVDYGVINYQNMYYWKNKQSRLNYAMQTKQVCSGGLADQNVLYDYQSIMIDIFEDDATQGQKDDYFSLINQMLNEALNINKASHESQDNQKGVKMKKNKKDRKNKKSKNKKYIVDDQLGQTPLQIQDQVIQIQSKKKNKRKTLEKTINQQIHQVQVPTEDSEPVTEEIKTYQIQSQNLNQIVQQRTEQQDEQEQNDLSDDIQAAPNKSKKKSKKSKKGKKK